MLTEQSDLWDHPTDPICVTTNPVIAYDGGLVMGRGIAREAADRFPDIRFWLAQAVLRRGNNVMSMPTGMTPGFRLLTFPTKWHWQLDAEIDLILRSCAQLRKVADAGGFQTVRLPRPGCGNGGLKWTDLYSTVAHELDDRFIVHTK